MELKLYDFKRATSMTLKIFFNSLLKMESDNELDIEERFLASLVRKEVSIELKNRLESVDIDDYNIPSYRLIKKYGSIVRALIEPCGSIEANHCISSTELAKLVEPKFLDFKEKVQKDFDIELESAKQELIDAINISKQIGKSINNSQVQSTAQIVGEVVDNATSPINSNGSINLNKFTQFPKNLFVKAKNIHPQQEVIERVVEEPVNNSQVEENTNDDTPLEEAISISANNIQERTIDVSIKESSLDLKSRIENIESVKNKEFYNRLKSIIEQLDTVVDHHKYRISGNMGNFMLFPIDNEGCIQGYRLPGKEGDTKSYRIKIAC